MRDAKALVLLIDDIEEIVEELLTFMELHGICAVGVNDLNDALLALEENPSIRVLACDVRLGLESGLSIVPLVRANPVLRDRPFRYLFITGDPLRPDPLSQMPDHLILTKPVQPQALIDILRRLLDEMVEPLSQEGL